MTPAKQDKELREILESAYGSAYQHGLNGNTPNLIKLAIDDIIQLITADRKRVALEARINELRLASDMQYMMRRENRVRYCSKRIAELKAQQEEVK